MTKDQRFVSVKHQPDRATALAENCQGRNHDQSTKEKETEENTAQANLLMAKRLVIDSRSKGDGSIVTGNFNNIEVGEEDDEHKKVAQRQWRIAQAIGARLVRAYNNRQWKVIVDIKGGMLIIACDSISNHKGYHIHMNGKELHELEEAAIGAAGEILERHNLSRLKLFNPDVIEDLPRDLNDDVIAADSAPEPTHALWR